MIAKNVIHDNKRQAQGMLSDVSVTLPDTSDTYASPDPAALPRLRAAIASLRAGLGNDATIAANMPRRLKAFKLLGFAQGLLIGNDVRAVKGGKHRTRLCHRRRHYLATEISIHLSPDAANSSASLGGVQTCGSVWACPICAPRIASQRGKEIQQALDWSEENGLVPVMLTLTARHTGEMSLDHIKSRFKAAWRFFTKARAWRKFKADFSVEQTITAREVLYSLEGGNGWHYHMHSLLFIRREAMNEAIETDMQAELRPDWLAALAKHELTAIDEYGLNVSAHGDVPGKYLAKLGLNPEQNVTDVRYEISGAGNKQGRSGVNVWTLLDRASRRDPQGRQQAGSKLAEKCYLEYVTAMQGDNWITWSQGFKKLIGLDEQPDEELADSDEGQPLPVWMTLSPEQFYPVAQARDYAGLLKVAAETRSREDVFTFINELRDSLMSRYSPVTHAPGQSPAAPASAGNVTPATVTDEQLGSFSSIPGPPLAPERRAAIEQLQDRLYRWRANRAFVRSHIHAPEIRARELATMNRQIADGEALLESLTYVRN